MKTLILLRHAKSGWDDGIARDFDRPLNGKGERAARTVGRRLREDGLTFDQVVASSAVRVRETLAQLWLGYGTTPDVTFDTGLYLATVDGLLDRVQQTEDSVDRLLLVGHNPGLEDLVLTLVPDHPDDRLRDDVEEKFPTASVAVLALAIDSWTAAKPGAGKLERFIRPRDLDPALGPDRG
ncbi:phosphohistidine phosphatase [Sphingomonas jejuensis]|uniref:Phosphohistidine phosphatase n=1 Tax=Sphingomonas jejuensis TaxID=904715 RepID=A0ABX0XNC5_9SPHN|nr:histidine phosphatase family protein [Sphingomonas jejuensis]NJC34874.1 phosphohistidine phosphatase [Sphingomonas jejuensis]